MGRFCTHSSGAKWIGPNFDLFSSYVLSGFRTRDLWTLGHGESHSRTTRSSKIYLSHDYNQHRKIKTGSIGSIHCQLIKSSCSSVSWRTSYGCWSEQRTILGSLVAYTFPRRSAVCAEAGCSLCWRRRAYCLQISCFTVNISIFAEPAVSLCFSALRWCFLLLLLLLVLEE